jgi:hypothetical protein
MKGQAFKTGKIKPFEKPFGSVSLNININIKLHFTSYEV